MPTWQNVQLRVANGGETRQLGAELDRPVATFGLSELVGGGIESPIVWLDHDHLAAVVTDRGVSSPWRFGRDGSVERLIDGPVTCVALAAGDGRLVTIASVDGAAAEAYEVDAGRLRQITRNNARWFASFHRPSEAVRVPPSAGKPAVHGWLLRARAHGAPGRSSSSTDGGPYLAVGPTRGWTNRARRCRIPATVRLNPRGSVSYGEEHARALHGVWGDPDSEDLIRTIDWAVRAGLADRDRVGLCGLSYGGYMVHWLLANFPGKFKAAVSENPVTDILADLGAGDFPAFLDEGIGVGPFPEKADNWHARSSIYRIQQTTRRALASIRWRPSLPTDPPEIPFSNRRCGGTVEMVRYPEESHLLLVNGRPDRRVDRIDRIDRIVAWFEKYLR